MCACSGKDRSTLLSLVMFRHRWFECSMDGKVSGSSLQICAPELSKLWSFAQVLAWAVVEGVLLKRGFSFLSGSFEREFL